MRMGRLCRLNEGTASERGREDSQCSNQMGWRRGCNQASLARLRFTLRPPLTSLWVNKRAYKDMVSQSRHLSPIFGRTF